MYVKYNCALRHEGIVGTQERMLPHSTGTRSTREEFTLFAGIGLAREVLFESWRVPYAGLQGPSALQLYRETDVTSVRELVLLYLSDG